MMDMFTEDNGDRPNFPNIGLVVTDGRSNNKTETYMAAMQLKATGIKVMVVGEFVLALFFIYLSTILFILTYCTSCLVIALSII